MIPQNRKQWLEGQKARSPGNVSYPIPVERGGTGGTTAEEARANLGVLDGPTLPVSIANGGTGGTTAEEARVNLGISSDGVTSGTGVVTCNGDSPTWETVVIDLSPSELTATPFIVFSNGDPDAQPDGVVVNANPSGLADSPTQATARLRGRPGGFRINLLIIERVDSGSGGGGGVETVNEIPPTNGNVNVTIEMSQAAYNAISEPNPNVTYNIY